MQERSNGSRWSDIEDWKSASCLDKDTSAVSELKIYSIMFNVQVHSDVCEVYGESELRSTPPSGSSVQPRRLQFSSFERE